MKFRAMIILFVLTFSQVVRAQTPQATVRGKVMDQVSGMALLGATVQLLSDNTPWGTTTDSSGMFALKVPPGQYALQARYVGYEELIVPEVWARAGKEVVLNVAMDIALTEMEPFTVSAIARTELTPLGTRTFTVEQSLRYPATFFDPVRMATTTAGVVAANDQANHLIIRGNSPNANNWTLEGVETVNPNHLSNAGTANDLPTLSGGGVNMLSAQMLSTSQLHVGVLPVQFGNATGGIMDMRLRSGNNTQQEWTAQAGLLGIDLSAEGPLGKKGGASYLVNYRYSTLGLLSEMGVDLGDEVIKFQDLAAHVTVPIGKRSELRLIGMGGNSSNEFEAVRDTAEWEFDKNGRDITYEAMTGIVGGVLELGVGKRGKWKNAVMYSSSEQEREGILLTDDLMPFDTTTSELQEKKLSVVTNYSGAIGGRGKFTVGIALVDRELNNLFEEQIENWLFRPYMDVHWSLSDRLQATLGVGHSSITFNNSSVIEPRGALRWRTLRSGYVSLAYGRRSMLPWHQVVRVNSPGATFSVPYNQSVGLTASDDLELTYSHPFSERSTLVAEVYYQQLSNLPSNGPLIAGFGTATHLHNNWQQLVGVMLGTDGSATNMGLELTYDHWFSEGKFMKANATVYDSQYSFKGFTSAPSRWNGNYLFNFMAGKEWAKTKEDRMRTWGFSGRANYAGGQRYTSIDTELGFLAFGEPYGAKLNDTYRLDLRIYLKKDRKGRTGMWALDLQNATNAQNEAYKYYDQRKGEVVTKYQLGIIPNLSYRIEF